MSREELKAHMEVRIRELKKLGASEDLIRDTMNTYVRLFVLNVLERVEKEIGT